MHGRREGEKLMADIARLLGGAQLRLNTDSGIEHDAGCQLVSSDASRIKIVIKAPYDDKLRTELYSLHRSAGHFSDFEVSLCDEIAKGATILWSPFEGGKRRLHIRTAVNESAMLVGISRFVRSRRGHFLGAATFISIVQDLTFSRYEGKPCTSGFICLQQDPTDLRASFSEKELKAWSVEKLSGGPIPVDHSFFKSVGSYRYVDGATKLYVASVQGSSVVPGVVHGTIELIDRKLYSLTELMAYAHLKKMLPRGESFVVLANRNGDVDVVPRRYDGHFLRWTKGAWHIVNMDLMKALLASRLEDKRMVKAIIGAALTLSFLRYGTLVLVADDKEALPASGSIDESPLGKALQNQMKGRSIRDLVETGQFMNALSSDGLTTLARDGTLLDTGMIISNARIRAGESGGARTAAAREASRYGIVIKVSADGPISLFRKGKMIYQTG